MRYVITIPSPEHFSGLFLFQAPPATLYLIKNREQDRAVYILNSQEVKPRKG